MDLARSDEAGIAIETEALALARSARDLRGWVREHEVCWETTPHREAAAGAVRTVGYDVALSARCVGGGPWDPGGERAREMRERLGQLAAEVIPADAPEDVGLAPVEPTLQMRAQSDWEPEARVVIEVRHGHDYFAAVDDEERGCVQAIERGLESWGAARDAWPRRPRRPS